MICSVFFSCDHILDYFPKAFSYSAMGDLFIVAVKNEEHRLGDLESDEKRRDVILRLDSFSTKINRFHSTDHPSWISDLTVLQNDDILLW